MTTAFLIREASLPGSKKIRLCLADSGPRPYTVEFSPQRGGAIGNMLTYRTFADAWADYKHYAGTAAGNRPQLNDWDQPANHERTTLPPGAW